MSDPSSTQSIHSKTVIACLVIAALGVGVWFNYYMKVKTEQIDPRLPMKNRVEQDILLTDQHGKQRRFKELQGKVWVVSWLFTRCSYGCAGLAQELESIQEKFASEPGFALVSVTVDPAEDTPEVLRNWTANHGFNGDNWWFVTGEEKSLIPFMEKNFELSRDPVVDPPKDGPQDKFRHTMAFRLIDAKGNIRGDRYYPFSEAAGGGYVPRDIRGDIRQLLDEAKKDQQNP